MPIEKPVGREVSWLVDFNKIGPPNQVGSYDFYYDGVFVGVDYIGELVDMAIFANVIEKGGAGWFTLPNGEKVQGRPNVITAIREDLDLMEKIEAGINV
jgi:hypothetical protein